MCGMLPIVTRIRMESGPGKPSNNYMCVPKRTGERGWPVHRGPIASQSQRLACLATCGGSWEGHVSATDEFSPELQASLEKPFPPIQAH